MDFITSFFRAVFIERDKAKIKDSIVTIALVIISFWVVKSYNNINNSITNNSTKIDRLDNYRLVVINLSDSVFTVKSSKILEETDNRIETVVELIHELDEKRRSEIDYVTKYKDKSYEEIMDILKLNEENWEFEVRRNRIKTSFKTIEPESLIISAPSEEIMLQPMEAELVVEESIPEIIEDRMVAEEEIVGDIEPIENPRRPKRERSDSTKNIFKTIGGWFKPN